MLDATHARKLLLELGHLLPHRQLAALEHLCGSRGLLRADVRPGETDQELSRYQAIVRSRPSSRSTCASKPSSSRALSTVGTRISTSAWGLLEDDLAGRTGEPDDPRRQVVDRHRRARVADVEGVADRLGVLEAEQDASTKSST